MLLELLKDRTHREPSSERHRKSPVVDHDEQPEIYREEIIVSLSLSFHIVLSIVSFPATRNHRSCIEFRCES